MADINRPTACPSCGAIAIPPATSGASPLWCPRCNRALAVGTPVGEPDGGSRGPAPATPEDAAAAILAAGDPTPLPEWRAEPDWRPGPAATEPAGANPTAATGRPERRRRRLPRRALLLAAGAVLLTGLAAGAYVLFPVALEWLEPNRYEGDDGAAYYVELPGRAKPTQVAGLNPPVRAYVYQDPATRTVYSTWVWPIPEDERDALSDEELAFHYALRGGNVTGFARTGGSWRRGGVVVGQTQGRLIDKSGTGVVRVAILDERAYVLRVQGPNVDPEAPGIKAVLDSLRPAAGPPPPPDLPPPGPPGPAPGHRPLTRIDPFFAIAFAPQSGAVYTTRPPDYGGTARFRYARAGGNPSPEAPPGLLARYAYPSFAPAGVYKVPRLGFHLAADEARGLLFMAVYTRAAPDIHPRDTTDPSGVGDVHVYRMPPAAAAEAALEPARVIPVGGTIRHLSLSPDGRFVYYLVAFSPADVRAVRLSADTLEPAGEARLEPNTELMCVHPGSGAVYTAATVTGHQFATPDGVRPEGRLQEIDPATWEVRRTVRVMEDPFQLEPGPDGLLLMTSGSNQHRNLVILDPNAAGRPAIRRVGSVYMKAYLRVAPDGRRAYVGVFNEAAVVDLDEAIRHRRWRTLGPVQGDPRSPTGGLCYLSPDGAALVYRPGSVFSLTEGPLPAAAPPAAPPPEPMKRVR
jgi:hypothetical protein